MKSMSFVIVSLLMALSVQVGVCQRWDKKTKVKFNVPVQVPNADLPAGTYVFKLASSDANPGVLRRLANETGGEARGLRNFLALRIDRPGLAQPVHAGVLCTGASGRRGVPQDSCDR
jgi:hypothetical protein